MNDALHTTGMDRERVSFYLRTRQGLGSARWLITRLLHNWLNIWVIKLSGRRASLTPFRWQWECFGNGDFHQIGNEFLGYFTQLAGLKPDHRVLDIGCGIGRMAVPLTKYLNQQGAYVGFDIIDYGIRWCQKNISSRYNNFQFLHVDIKNKRYNPRGKSGAETFVFPFNDHSFDFVFLTSVFTHMLPEAVENYTRQISRVLKPGGKVLITFLIINQESLRLMREGKSVFNLHHFRGPCWVINKTSPEDVIGYEELYIRETLRRYRLSLIEPIHYGLWCGRKEYLGSHDIVMAEKI
ncbi:MAG: methyltransferase domain-containing protein [Patescibacteria group bacterium]|nr:methyltransferase domain-containing protein [Patescibacteria group bacterium]